MRISKYIKTILTGCLVFLPLLCSTPALAQIVDLDADIADVQSNSLKVESSKVGVNIALESSDPIPQQIVFLDNSLDKITWAQLNGGGIKLIDGGQLGIGFQFYKAYLEMAFHVGFRMVSGDLFEGSLTSDGKSISNYKAFIVPLRLYLKLVPFKWRVRPYLGLFMGVNPGKLRYLNGESEIINQSITQFAGGFRAGLDFDIVRGFGLGFYFEGELTTKQEVMNSVPLSNSGFRFGLAFNYHFKIVSSNSLRNEDSSELLPEVYKNMLAKEEQEKALQEQKAAEETKSDSLEKAFDEIKKGDDLRNDRRCSEALEHYRLGLSYLPKTRDAEKNIAVPVRLDLAGCLIELDYTEEAITVLREAQRADPNNMQVSNALEALGVMEEPAPAAKSAPVIVPVEKQQVPVENYEPLEERPAKIENDTRGPVISDDNEYAPIETLNGEL